METSIRESNFVLLVCTPTFAEKADAGKGGVGYEKSIVTGEIFGASPSPLKFVPLLRTGSPESSLPSYLKSRAYIDFRDDGAFGSSLENLLRHIYQSPKYERPPLGAKPNFAASEPEAQAIKRQPLADSPLATFELVYLFAKSNAGLGKYSAEAEQFALSFMSQKKESGC